MQWLSRCCHSPIFKHKCVVAKVVLRQPNNLSTSCCHVATSDRGYGWEDYPTPTLLPDGKRVSNVRNVVITRRHYTHLSLPLRLRFPSFTYRARKLRGDLRSQWESLTLSYLMPIYYLNPTTIGPSFGRIVKFPYLLAPKLKASLLWYMLSTVLFCAAYVW